MNSLGLLGVNGLCRGRAGVGPLGLAWRVLGIATHGLKNDGARAGMPPALQVAWGEASHGLGKPSWPSLFFRRGLPMIGCLTLCHVDVDRLAVPCGAEVERVSAKREDLRHAAPPPRVRSA